MKTIRIIDKLHLNNGEVKCKTSNGKFQQIHLRQGDLDGACTAYSVMMILIMIKAINFSDISIYKKHDKRNAKGRLIKEFLETKGLYRDGAYYDQVQKNLQHSFAKMVKSDWINTEGEESIKEIKNKLENDMPVLISVSFSGGKHALVAIGLEYDKDNNITKIFCLDPSFDSPCATYWNSIINVEFTDKGKYPYYWITAKGSNDCKVQLCDLIVIEKKS